MENNHIPSAAQGSSSSSNNHNHVSGVNTDMLCAEIKKLNNNVLLKFEQAETEAKQRYGSLCKRSDDQGIKIQDLYDYFLPTLSLGKHC